MNDEKKSPDFDDLVKSYFDHFNKKASNEFNKNKEEVAQEIEENEDDGMKGSCDQPKCGVKTEDRACEEGSNITVDLLLDGRDSDNGPERSSLCDGCATAKWSYKCPACSFRSCSLACCQSHKARLNCTGARDHSAFVPCREYSASDYFGDLNYLESVSRFVSSSQRSHLPPNRRKQTKKPSKCTDTMDTTGHSTGK